MMTFADALIPEFDDEMGNTRKILACVPDGKFSWKPHEKSMALGRLAHHTAETCSWAVTVMTQTEFSPPADYKPQIPENTAQLLEYFDKTMTEAREHFAKASDNDFDVRWTMSWGGQTIIDDTRRNVVRKWVMSHMIHHRAQLGVYLRLLNVDFPGVYGPSASDMEKMQQPA